MVWCDRVFLSYQKHKDEVVRYLCLTCCLYAFETQCLTFKEGLGLGVSGNSVIRKVIDWSCWKTKGFLSIRMIKKGSSWWMSHVECIGDQLENLKEIDLSEVSCELMVG